MSVGGQQVQQLTPQQQSDGSTDLSQDPTYRSQPDNTYHATSLTDPNMSIEDWARLTAGRDPLNQAGVPSTQWGPEGIAPPPGSAAAYDYWKRLEYGNSSGEIAPEFQNAAPMDPSQWSDMYERMTRNVSSYGGGMQVPVGVTGSQFNPSRGNPNFTINQSGYGVLTPQGQSNLNQYAMQQLQGIYSNAAKNRSGLSGFLGTPLGGLSMLGLPLAVGGGVGLLGGAAGALGAGDVAAGVPAYMGTVEDMAAAPAAAAAAPAAAAATTPSWLSSVGSFLSNPWSAMGLPSWVNPTMQGIGLLNTAQQMMFPPQQGQG
jgi:hypothetical protein